MKQPLKCRICKGGRLVLFLSLGDQPHCNRFIRPEELAAPEPRYPLDVYFCEDCSLVQLGYAVPAETMFREYLYVSGTTRTLTEHFRRLAKTLVARYGLGARDLVVDVGSNDGTLLRGFQAEGVRTLGIEPARNIAKAANEAGVETVNEFMGEAVARDVAARKGKARLITAAGVFFHVDDLDDFVRGVGALLADDGTFVVQAIYLGDMIALNHFDNIYHEHLCYYSLLPLLHLFRRFGMEVVDVERIPIHGGSFLVYARRAGVEKPAPSVERLIAWERGEGLHDLATFRRFAARVEKVRADLVRLVDGLRAQGKRIYAYGAPAKGNTLLNYCGFGPDRIEVAVEKNPLKCGYLTPGMHIPVVHEDSIRDRPPDCFLLLPWNFAEELLAKEKDYRARGGKFIVPIPEPHVV